MNKHSITELVQQVWHDNTSSTFLLGLVQEHDQDFRDQFTQALRNFISTMWITRLDTRTNGNTLDPQFNVFTTCPPSIDDNSWTKLRLFLANRTYSSLMHGQATVKITPFDCGICHRVDHPRSLCPFPSLEG